MRYTTVIDLTEMPEVWRNSNVTRLYLYMALRCGYHDQDRDVLTMSTRNLAIGAGITHSACRHALRVLLAHQLLVQEGNSWRVKKFILDIKPSARTQKNTTVSDSRLVERDLEKENRDRIVYKLVKEASLKDLKGILSDLKEQKNTTYKEVKFGQQDVKTLVDWIEFKQKRAV